MEVKRDLLLRGKPDVNPLASPAPNFNAIPWRTILCRRFNSQRCGGYCLVVGLADLT